MKIYRKIDYQQQVNGDSKVGRNDEICNDNQPANHHPTRTVSETQFVARVIALPLLQEGLSSTQSMASRSRLGRVLLDRTHLMIQRLSHTIHRAHQTPTYQHYFRQDGYLRQSLIKMDGWACSSLDIIETRIPLLQQPTATIMDTLIIKPRHQLTSTLDSTWDLVITQPLARLNGRINKDLDGLEQWMKRHTAFDGYGCDDGRQGTSINQRVLHLGGSALSLGLDQAAATKDQCTAWAQPLFSQGDAFPLTRSIRSRFGVLLSDWKLDAHLTTKTESTH